MLRAVKRTRLSEEIVAQLAELIGRGQLRPGARLPSERGLAEQLKVSRSSVREAVRVMELKGLLVSRPGAGTFVANGPPEAILQAFTELAEEEQVLQDVFELRMLVEPPIAALAALRSTAEDLDRLETVLREQEEHLGLAEAAGHIDAAFHSALAQATHNRALQKLGTTLMDVLAPSRHQRLQTAQRAQHSLASHRRILAAVDAGDSAAARHAMADHILQVDRTLFGLPETALATAARNFTLEGTSD